MVIYPLCFPLLFYLLRTKLQVHVNLTSKELISDHSDQSHHLSRQWRSSVCHGNSLQFILHMVDQLCFLNYNVITPHWLKCFQWFPIILRITLKSFTNIITTPWSCSWLHFQSYICGDLQRNIWIVHGVLFFITKTVEEGHCCHLLDRNRSVWYPLA